MSTGGVYPVCKLIGIVAPFNLVLSSKLTVAPVTQPVAFRIKAEIGVERFVTVDVLWPNVPSSANAKVPSESDVELSL